MTTKGSKKVQLQYKFTILSQPSETTCGPTCLHAIYRYYGDDYNLDQIISEVDMLEDGGTLAVLLGCHALKNGYRATIYTFDLNLFDPSWFRLSREKLQGKLVEQAEFKKSKKIDVATKAYLGFLQLGGILKFEDLTPSLLVRYLGKKMPILTGLSATYLYKCKREFGSRVEQDDIRGEPSGHFVVLTGIDAEKGLISLADPYLPNPYSSHNPVYMVTLEHLICSILLGITTFDANLLIIEKGKGSSINEKSSYR